ncbi:sirohydrochlorin chelatase [Nocardioides sp. KIGAM211]|uniref:Sirohydrochlorin chelatase n=1 Tax=Nocardioides luti TaxID=2761101 RepID=A0A7X0VCU2_9ACTN|nr:CbiX/SirB N-terminal domain-containing protein [Nocardioides luti]MBB6628588.1 sirohydrochlorin chelatase [Nocardioides luti]
MRLVTVAHGTRYAPGNDVAREIAAAAGARLGVSASAAYVELCEPSFASVVAATSVPTVAVPLLLSTGFHVRQDLPAAVAAAGPAHPVVLTPTLGPHPLLAAAQAARLVAAGARPGQQVVLVAAGSRDPRTDPDLARAAALLAAAWGGPVELATLTGRGPRPADVVRRGAVASPYLLAPGHFADRARDESLAAGAALVADVIGPHRFVAELVARRFRALAPAVAA